MGDGNIRKRHSPYRFKLTFNPKSIKVLTVIIHKGAHDSKGKVHGHAKEIHALGYLHKLNPRLRIRALVVSSETDHNARFFAGLIYDKAMVKNLKIISKEPHNHRGLILDIKEVEAFQYELGVYRKS